MARRERPVLNRLQRADLQLILKDKYEELLPLLEQGVCDYRAGLTLSDGREEARKHAEAAAAFERSSHRFLQSLEAVLPIAQRACSLKYIPSTSTGLPSSARTLSDLLTLRWVTGDKSRAVLQELITDTRAWKDQARRFGRRKRGRKTGGRLRLAEWVGIRLARADIRLTKGADGRWARTLGVVYEAAGVKAPQDLFKDVHAAYQVLHEILPEYAPRQTKSLHKSRKK